MWNYRWDERLRLKHMDNKNFEEQYGKLLTTIKFRPFYQSIALAVSGAILLIICRNAFGYTVGGFLFVTGVASLLSKDRRVGELYENGVVIYDAKGIEPIQDFPYTKVVEWNTGLDRENCMTFYLDDKTKSSFPTYSTFAADRILRKKMPEKDSKEIERRKSAELTKNSRLYKKLFGKKKNKDKTKKGN